MNLTDFSSDISKEFGLTKRQSKKILSFLQKRMRFKLLHGTEITLREIGSFVLQIIHPKKFLNLQTGKIEKSERRFKLAFKMSRKFDKELRQKKVYGYSRSQE